MKYEIIEGKIKTGYLNFLTGNFLIGNKKVSTNNIPRLLMLRKSKWAKVRVLNEGKTKLVIEIIATE